MSLSPTTAWTATMLRSDVRVRFWIDIYDGTTHWQCLTGSVDASSDLRSSTYPVGATVVSPVGIRLDPFSRKVQIDELFIDFNDNWLRPIVVQNRLKGQRVKVRVGAACLDSADFLDLFEGPLHSVIPSGDGLLLPVSVLSPITVLENTKITGYWLNKHPFEVLYDGSGGGILEKGGLDSFDASSFDPSNYTDDIAHLIISRLDAKINGGLAEYLGSNVVSDWGGLSQPISALQIAEEVLQLVNAHMVVNESGEMKVVRFDATAAVVDDWGDDVIIPGTFKQDELDANIINRIAATYGRDPDGRHKQTYQADDTDSQSTYAYPGVAERILGEKFTTNWLDSNFHLQNDITDVATTSILFRADLHALSGNRSDGFAAISVTQPLWLMFDSTHIPGNGNSEIVKCESLTRNADILGDIQVLEPSTGLWVNESGWSGNCELASMARGQLGTTASAHTRSTWVYDITPIVLLIDELLKRFKNGCPVIEFNTNMTRYKTQVGDLVTVTAEEFVAFGLDGIDDSYKFEVIGKEPDWFASPPVVRWKLAFAGLSSLTRTGHGHFGRNPRGAMGVYQMQLETVMQGFVESGLVLSAVAGLNGSLSAGSISNGTFRHCLAEAVPHTYPASKDTYVRLDMETGGVIYESVAVAAAAPYRPKTEVLLGYMTTGAATITAVNGDQITHPLGSIDLIESRSLDDIQDGSTYYRLGSVDAAHLAQEASLDTGVVTESKLGSLAVTTAKLDTGSVVEAKLGTGAVTETRLGPLAVTAGKLDTGSVTEAKLGSLAVTTAKLDTGSVVAIKGGESIYSGVGLNSNINFSQWTRG